MKKVITRTYVAFLEFAKERSAGRPHSLMHEDKLIPKIKRNIKFNIAAVSSVGINAGSILHHDDYAKKWLTANASGQWHLEYAAISWAIARIYFEDEGDAFRFTWAHEDLSDHINQVS